MSRLAPLLAALASAQVDPAARCPNAGPSSAQCCYGNKTSPVMGGVDFVNLATKKDKGVDEAAYGLSSITAQLNGYEFLFLTEANRKAFTDDPWSFAPAWGGF